MSFLLQPFKDASKRFLEWIHPPGLRVYRSSRRKARVWRYPAPGSEPINREDAIMHYKTAYRDSIHNVRYGPDVELKEYNENKLFISTPFSETPEQRLVRYGFLTQQDINNPDAIIRARKEYEHEIGESVDIKVHHDDFGIANKPFQTRDAVAEIVHSTIENINENSRTEAWQNDVNDVYNQQFYVLRGYDYAGDDPVYRQLILEVEKEMEDIIDDRLKFDKVLVFRQDPKFWRVLDDSFSPENVELVQATIKESKEVARYKEDFHPEDHYINTVAKNKYIE